MTDDALRDRVDAAIKALALAEHQNGVAGIEYRASGLLLEIHAARPELHRMLLDTITAARARCVAAERGSGGTRAA